jgi:cyclic-di-AMP phosphodiesterase PgpH
MKTFLKKWINRLSFRKSNNGSRERSWTSRLRDPSCQIWLIGIAAALILTLFLSPTLQLPVREYRVGEIATKEIKSPQDLLVEDMKSTQEKRIDAEKSVLSIYDYDPTPLAEIEGLVSVLQKEERKSDPGPKKKRAFETSLPFPLDQREWSILERERFNPSLRGAVFEVLAPILKDGIITGREQLDPDSGKGIVIRDIKTREERRESPPLPLLDFKEARTKLRSQVDLVSPPLGRELLPVFMKVAGYYLRPNLTFNKDETEERKAKATANVSTVYIQVKRGDVILKAGDRVREDHLLKIKAIKQSRRTGHLLSVLIGLGLLTFLFLAGLYQFSVRNIKKIALSRKDILFFTSTLLSLIAFLKLFLMVTDVLGGGFLSIPSSSYYYLFPIAAGAMLVRIVINSEVAIVFAILSSYFSAFLMGNQLFFFIFSFVGSVIGAHKVARCEQRSVLLRAGLVVGGINLLVILAYNLISGNPFRMTLLSDLIMGFAGGIAASFIVLGIAPIVESLFAYTTDIKLLELANMDSPILKDLILQAPGTYHHSVMVGSLVEAAAKAIGANPLLGRVSAYYHDIGKLKKPFYFIENTGGMENKHDHLAPSMSSLILISHVKDGVEIARENHLGERIGDIIEQHHGTALISYFYQKAREIENPDMDPLDETEFRYPGPKPQTREAGIVMLADVVEAASRSLSEPSPSRIKGLVQRITNGIFLDGQLEECEMTLKDLHKIEDSFVRILTAIFHQRIDYPDSQSLDSTHPKSDEDLDSKPSKTLPFRPKKSSKNGAKHLGRPGSAGG